MKRAEFFMGLCFAVCTPASDLFGAQKLDILSHQNPSSALQNHHDKEGFNWADINWRLEKLSIDLGESSDQSRNILAALVEMIVRQGKMQGDQNISSSARRYLSLGTPAYTAYASGGVKKTHYISFKGPCKIEQVFNGKAISYQIQQEDPSHLMKSKEWKSYKFFEKSVETLEKLFNEKMIECYDSIVDEYQLLKYEKLPYFGLDYNSEAGSDSDSDSDSDTKDEGRYYYSNENGDRFYYDKNGMQIFVNQQAKISPSAENNYRGDSANSPEPRIRICNPTDESLSDSDPDFDCIDNLKSRSK